MKDHSVDGPGAAPPGGDESVCRTVSVRGRNAETEANLENIFRPKFKIHSCRKSWKLVKAFSRNCETETDKKCQTSYNMNLALLGRFEIDFSG